MNQIQQTDLIVLPEMFHTAFSMKAQELAENCEKSETIAWLRDNPRRQRINPTLLKALNNLDSITKR